MKLSIYSLFILLMLAGNCFGLYQLITGKQEFLAKFPRLNGNNYLILQLLPVINIIALSGMWYFKTWSPWLAIAGALLVIAVDLYFQVWYHLWLAVPSTAILVFFIIKYWNHFK